MRLFKETVRFHLKLKYRTLHTARSCTSTTVDISFRFLIFRGRASGPIKYHRPYVTASCNWYCILTASFHVIVRTGDYARRCRPREAVGSKGRINVSPYSLHRSLELSASARSPPRFEIRKGINRGACWEEDGFAISKTVDSLRA